MEETIVINKTDKPNSISFRWGGVGSDMKLYFKDEHDLLYQLQALNNKMPEIRLNIDEIIEKMAKEV